MYDAYSMMTMAPELTDGEKAVRDLFVEEYVKDFDPYAACIRVGFQAVFAQEYAKNFMVEPYVQRKIAETVRATKDAETELNQDKALMKSVLREASHKGPFSSRVQAVGMLYKLHGLDRPEGVDADKETALIDALKDFAKAAPA